MIAVLRVLIFSYFLLLNRVFKKACQSIIIQSHHSQMVDQNVSGSGKEFLDLARLYLYLKVKVSKADGSNLDAASKGSFCELSYCKLVQSSGRHFGL